MFSLRVPSSMCAWAEPRVRSSWAYGPPHRPCARGQNGVVLFSSSVVAPSSMCAWAERLLAPSSMCAWAERLLLPHRPCARGQNLRPSVIRDVNPPIVHVRVGRTPSASSPSPKPTQAHVRYPPLALHNRA